jgi:hypothetical protein
VTGWLRPARRSIRGGRHDGQQRHQHGDDDGFAVYDRNDNVVDERVDKSVGRRLE